MMNLLLIGSQAESLLVYVFIAIFVLTALITLASLPIVNILEVIGIIIIAGRGLFGVGDGQAYEDFSGKDVRFEVHSSPSGTQYRIFNKVDTVYQSSASDLNVKNQTIHFCRDSDNVYYLFRITAADLTNADGRPPFVDLLQIRLEPSVNFRKK